MKKQRNMFQTKQTNQQKKDTTSGRNLNEAEIVILIKDLDLTLGKELKVMVIKLLT